MKSIPSALKQKLVNRFKVDSTGSKPKLRAIATQTLVNTLLTEPIHGESLPAFGDAAIRQTTGEKELSLAYAVCIDGSQVDSGQAKIYKRKFPAEMDYQWEYLWTLGEASDVAIEFNGTWKMNAEKEWYYLETEVYPYIFYVRSGNLYVQKWDDSENAIQLASGVSNISSCKGWQSSIDTELDQGLIIGYIKSGAVYYRALCAQEDGTYVWENEHEVTELGTGNVTLAVIRTNDFRIGFLSQNNGNMLLALSKRNYAGMSVRPETVTASAINVGVLLPLLNRMYGFHHECASANVSQIYFMLDPVDSADIAVSSIEKINRDTGFNCYGFRLNLSKALYGSIDSQFLSGCTLTGASATIASAELADDGMSLSLYTSTDIRRTVAVTVTTPENRNLWYYKAGQQKWYVTSLSGSVIAEIRNVYVTAPNETASASVFSASVGLVNAVFKQTIHTETASVSISSVTVTLEPVSNLPI